MQVLEILVHPAASRVDIIGFSAADPSVAVADRKLAWILPTAVSVAVVAAMLLFPYATGYSLASDPLWRLILMLWNGSDEWKHGMFVFPIAAVLLFLKRTVRLLM